MKLILIQIGQDFFVTDNNKQYGDIIIYQNGKDFHSIAEHSEHYDKYEWVKKLISTTQNVLGCEKLDKAQVLKELIKYETGIEFNNITKDVVNSVLVLFNQITNRFTLEEALNMWEMGSAYGNATKANSDARNEQRNYLKAISTKEWECEYKDGQVIITQKKTEVCENDEVLVIAGDKDTVGLKYFVKSIQKDGFCMMAGNKEGINCDLFYANIGDIDVYPDGDSDSSRFDYVLLKNKKQ